MTDTDKSPIYSAGDRLVQRLAGPTLRGYATMGGFLVAVVVTLDGDGFEKMLVIATKRPPFPMMNTWEGFPVVWNVHHDNQPRPANERSA